MLGFFLLLLLLLLVSWVVFLPSPLKKPEEERHFHQPTVIWFGVMSDLTTFRKPLGTSCHWLCEWARALANHRQSQGCPQKLILADEAERGWLKEKAQILRFWEGPRTWLQGNHPGTISNVSLWIGLVATLPQTLGGGLLTWGCRDLSQCSEFLPAVCHSGELDGTPGINTHKNISGWKRLHHCLGSRLQGKLEIWNLRIYLGMGETHLARNGADTPRKHHPNQETKDMTPPREKKKKIVHAVGNAVFDEYLPSCYRNLVCIVVGSERNG